MALALLAGAMFLVSFISAPDTLPGIELCYFKSLTGMPCPGCGLTHSVCAISHGDLSGAWEYNPFGFFFYLIGLLLLTSPILYRWRPGIFRWLEKHKAILRLLIFTYLAMSLYWVVEILPNQ